ncbi:WxL domain-containing protein [Lactiplantibacillus paraplantarum]|uniref:WxL domain-containing protein n=1 Tax=Lactiplantibacillus paraplantarum TaxID=60520 RepID=UPI0023AA264C|nr:WxL domain-containing protein [Lactiplantibacillus paraplantarum]WEE34855.1 WxL domain-containing protein [Lactiplantibacillus paraplantarum]
MRAFKLMTGLSGGVTALSLALMPIAALAAGPGKAEGNLTTVSSGYVADSTGNAEALSNAQFTVMPGELTLDAVPNIALGSTNVKDIASAGAALNATSANTSGGNGYDGNGSGNLNVSDYRGNHAGWTLTVGMGPFSSGPATIDSATLNLNMSKGTVDNSGTAAPTALTLNQSEVTNGWVASPQTLWNAAANTGEGSNTATTATSSSLQVGKQSNISAGTYTATLYWTLQNAPAAAAAPKAAS